LRLGGSWICWTAVTRWRSPSCCAPTRTAGGDDPDHRHPHPHGRSRQYRVGRAAARTGVIPVAHGPGSVRWGTGGVGREVSGRAGSCTVRPRWRGRDRRLRRGQCGTHPYRPVTASVKLNCSPGFGGRFGPSVIPCRVSCPHGRSRRRTTARCTGAKGPCRQGHRPCTRWAAASRLPTISLCRREVADRPPRWKV
jgi:hypothetical protein